MKVLRRAGRYLRGILAAIGFLVILATITPIDRYWAHAYAGSLDQPQGEVLIVLSAARDNGGIVSFSSYWRARYALMAWQSGGFQKIVVSGGEGPGIRNFLVAEGVPAQDIVAEWRSLTTRENAIETARLVANIPGRKVLLTSDFHMYRAIHVFRKAGIDVSPMAVPDVIKQSEHWNARFPAFETMVDETCKIVYYKLRGWI